MGGGAGLGAGEGKWNQTPRTGPRCYFQTTIDYANLGMLYRERVLFIGTQFSILYTSMYSPAEAATYRAVYVSSHEFREFTSITQTTSCTAIDFLKSPRWTRSTAHGNL